MSKRQRYERRKRERERLRDRQCGPPEQPKRKYESRLRAYDDAQIMTRLNHAPMSAYQCPHCGYWHIGHTPKKNRL